jgi:hypothetical protein
MGEQQVAEVVAVAGAEEDERKCAGHRATLT